MLAVPVLLAGTSAGNAATIGASAKITPAQQSAITGQTVTWATSWGTSGHFYQVVFTFGDGQSAMLGDTPSTSATFAHSFTSCAKKTYTQTLQAQDLATGLIYSATATTAVSPGTACRA
ncbi:MAG: hypothetical protein M3Y42_04285 [Actinomycetota bacterium]|nr:hypothetical protein [Actinomycetota bacterium]MDQ2956165.1 hypothetical protein [Actinomycetota bacterium]